jgi:hypothetical protein
MSLRTVTTTKKPRTFLNRRQQATRYSTSVKSIQRWGQDPRMNMPPEYDFNRIKKRAEDELEAWERTRVVTSAGDAAA